MIAVALLISATPAFAQKSDREIHCVLDRIPSADGQLLRSHFAEVFLAAANNRQEPPFDTPEANRTTELMLKSAQVCGATYHWSSSRSDTVGVFTRDTFLVPAARDAAVKAGVSDAALDRIWARLTPEDRSQLSSILEGRSKGAPGKARLDEEKVPDGPARTVVYMYFAYRNELEATELKLTGR